MSNKKWNPPFYKFPTIAILPKTFYFFTIFSFHLRRRSYSERVSSDDPYRYWVSWCRTKITSNRVACFVSSEKYLMRNLVFAIRWEQSLIFNSFFKIWQTEKHFLAFYSRYFSLLAFFVTRFFLFLKFWCFKLAFSVVFEKVI